MPIDQEIEDVPTTGYDPHFFPAEGDEILFRFTAETFLQVFSALINGAALTYPENWLQVVWDFQTNVEFPMSFCEKIIECMLNDEDTQDALALLIASNPQIQAALGAFIDGHAAGTALPAGQPLPAGASAADLLPNNPTCDPNKIWPACIGLVQTANRMIVDFLERWETYNNGGEIGKAILGAIPIIGELADVLGIDSIIDYANAIVDAIREGYDADYTLEYENELACELFCQARGTCGLSLDDMASILNARVSGALNLDNVIELFTSLIDADITGFNVADLYMAFFFNALKLANLIIPITWGIEKFITVVSVFDEPNNDWAALCEDCVEPFDPCETGTAIDFTSVNGGFVGYPANGPTNRDAIWYDDEEAFPGWGPSNYWVPNIRLAIVKNFGSPTVTNTSVVSNMQAAGIQIWDRNTPGGATILGSDYVGTANGDGTWTYRINGISLISTHEMIIIVSPATGSWTIPTNFRLTSVCYNAVVQNIHLIAAPGFPGWTLEYKATEAGYDKYLLTAIYTGNYAMGGAVNDPAYPAVSWYVNKLDPIEGTWESPYSFYIVNGGSYAFADIPNNVLTTSFGVYRVTAGATAYLYVSQISGPMP